jgi:histidyl-tRNA synthetase
VILGDNELAKGVVAVKDLDKGEQKEVALDKLAEALAS